MSLMGSTAKAGEHTWCERPRGLSEGQDTPAHLGPLLGLLEPSYPFPVGCGTGAGVWQRFMSGAPCAGQVGPCQEAY